MNIIKKYSFELALCIPVITLLLGTPALAELNITPESIIAGGLLSSTGFFLRYASGIFGTIGHYLLYLGTYLLCLGIASMCSEELLNTLIIIAGITGILFLIRNTYFLKSTNN